MRAQAWQSRVKVVREGTFLHTHKVVGQGGATLASPHPDTGRSPTAFKVQALARCTCDVGESVSAACPLPPPRDNRVTSPV